MINIADFTTLTPTTTEESQKQSKITNTLRTRLAAPARSGPTKTKDCE